MPLKYLNRSNNSTAISAGNSVLFNGSNQYLSVASNSAFDFGTGDFTIEGWINPTSIDGTYRCVFSIGNPVQIYARSGTLEIYFNDSDNTITYIVFASNGPLNAITANTWAHFAVVRSGTTFTAYINGVAGTPTTGVSAAVASTSTDAVIGNVLNLYPFSGYISNLRVVKGTAVYTSNFTPSTTPLTAIANTSLLTCNAPTIVDSSNNNFTITNNGAATVSSTVPFTASFTPAPSGMKFKNRNNSGTPTSTGKSVQFNGSNQYLSLASNAVFNFGTGSFTVECWFYATANVSSQQCLITNYSGPSAGWAIQITSGVIGANLSGDGFDISGGSPAINTWYHVALSGAQGSIKLFLNGVQIGSTYTGAVSMDTSAATTVGNIVGTAYMNGYISNVRVVKGTALYTSSFTVPTSPLTAIANTSLLTCNAATIVDNSSNNLTITNNNSATVSSTTPFTVASAASTMKMRKVNADPTIVTSGLVLNLDAGNASSYPGSGTSWSDLSGNNNNGTLFNGPAFSNSSADVISFDGADDYFQANINTIALDGDPSLSVDMFVRRRTGTNIGGGGELVGGSFWGIGGMGQGNSINGWTPTANLIHLDIYDSTRLATSAYYPENQFVHICWTKNGAGAETTNIKCYVNGSEVALTKTRNATRANQFNTSTSGKGVCLGRANADSASFPAPIDIGTFKVYSRALSSNEVLQNYNVIRARFGL
jgi:hypothetical protein